MIFKYVRAYAVKSEIVHQIAKFVARVAQFTQLTTLPTSCELSTVLCRIKNIINSYKAKWNASFIKCSRAGLHYGHERVGVLLPCSPWSHHATILWDRVDATHWAVLFMTIFSVDEKLVLKWEPIFVILTHVPRMLATMQWHCGKCVRVCDVHTVPGTNKCANDQLE
jgi:hypothetical protein